MSRIGPGVWAVGGGATDFVIAHLVFWFRLYRFPQIRRWAGLFSYPPPPTAQTDGDKDLIFCMDSLSVVPFGLIEAIFDKWPLSHDMGPPPRYTGGPRGGVKNFFWIFGFFLMELSSFCSKPFLMSNIILFWPLFPWFFYHQTWLVQKQMSRLASVWRFEGKKIMEIKAKRGLYCSLVMVQSINNLIPSKKKSKNPKKFFDPPGSPGVPQGAPISRLRGHL